MKFCVLDLETTGISSKFHELTEVAILNIENMELAEWDIKIKHPERCDKGAMLITNKTPQQLISRGKYLEDCIDDIDDFVKSISKYPDEIVCIGHNILSFDRNWLEFKWKELNHTWLANYWLDTLTMSKKFTRQVLGIQKTSHALGNMIKLAGLKENAGAHQSIEDVKSTYFLYNYLIGRGLKSSEFIKLSPTLMENLVSKPTKPVKKQKINDADINDVMGSMGAEGFEEDPQSDNDD